MLPVAAGSTSACSVVYLPYGAYASDHRGYHTVTGGSQWLQAHWILVRKVAEVPERAPAAGGVAKSSNEIRGQVQAVPCSPLPYALDSSKGAQRDAG